MPIGHWSNGPAWLAWNAGVLWFLPNHQVVDAFSTGLISPPNFGGTGGRALDFSASVYAGAPGFAGPSFPPTVIGTRNAPTTPAARAITIASRTIFLFTVSFRS